MADKINWADMQSEEPTTTPSNSTSKPIKWSDYESGEQPEVKAKFVDKPARDVFIEKGDVSTNILGQTFQKMLGRNVDPVQARYFKAFKIIDSDAPDSVKEKNLKTVLPEARFGWRGAKKTITIGEETYPIFKYGDEGYKEYISGPMAVDNQREFTNPQNKLLSVKREVVVDMALRGQKVNPDKFVELGRDSYGNSLLVIKKPFGGYKPGKYYWNKPGLSVGDKDAIAPFVRETAPAIAASQIMGPARALKAMGVVGGVEGVSAGITEASKKIGGYKSDLSNIYAKATGAALGEGMGRLAASYLTNLAVRIVGKEKIKAVDKAGNYTDELKAALKAKGIDEKEFAAMYKTELERHNVKALTPAQAIRDYQFRDLGKRAGIPTQATKGQLTREFGTLEHESRLLKDSMNGPALRDVYQNQDAALFKNLEILKQKTGGTADPEMVGVKMRKALASHLERRNKIERGIYEEAKTEAKKPEKMTQRAVDYFGTLKETEVNMIRKLEQKQVAAEFRDVLKYHGSNLPKEARAKIKEFSSGERPATLKELQEFKNHVINKYAETVKPGTEKMAIDELRKTTQKMIDTYSGSAADLYKRADRFHGHTKDIFKANDIIHDLMKTKGNAYNNKTYAVRSKDAHRRLLDGTDKAEYAKSIEVLSKTPKGKEVIKDMQATFIDDIKSKATLRQGPKDESRFSPTKFDELIDRYAKNGKLEILFPQKVVSVLKQIADVSRARQFPTGTVNTSNTYSALNNALNEGEKIPVLGKLVTGIKSTFKGYLESVEKQAQKKTAEKLTSPITDANFRKDLIKSKRMGNITELKKKLLREKIDAVKSGSIGYSTEQFSNEKK